MRSKVPIRNDNHMNKRDGGRSGTGRRSSARRGCARSTSEGDAMSSFEACAALSAKADLVRMCMWMHDPVLQQDCVLNSQRLAERAASRNVIPGDRRRRRRSPVWGGARWLEANMGAHDPAYTVHIGVDRSREAMKVISVRQERVWRYGPVKGRSEKSQSPKVVSDGADRSMSS